MESCACSSSWRLRSAWRPGKRLSMSSMFSTARNCPLAEISRGEAEPGNEPGDWNSPGLSLSVLRVRGNRADRRSMTRPSLVNCLVTAVDGSGRGSVAISTSRQTERCTALFLCDVERGITAAIGQVEEESPHAGRLIEDAKTEAGSMGLEDVPELALRLLAGSLSLNAAAPARPVKEWLERTLGRGFEPRPLPASVVEFDSGTTRELGAPAAGRRRSPGVPDMARQFTTDLRARRGGTACEKVRWRPTRTAIQGLSGSSSSTGSFIDWRLIGECCSGCTGSGAVPGSPSLPASAQILAWQLSDQQFAVPSHPFTVGAHGSKSGCSAATAGNRQRPQEVQRGERIGIRFRRGEMTTLSSRTGPGPKSRSGTGGRRPESH